MRFEHLNSIIAANLKHNVVPMLVGEPGIGKSSWLEALALQLGTKCFTLACNQLADKADLTGCRLVPYKTSVNPKTGEEETTYAQVFYPHKVIVDAIAYANDHPKETPILFLDEINRSTPDVTSEALSIPTARRIGDVPLPENLRVVVAGNDKGNVSALDTASISRFVLYRIEPDVNTFLAVNPNCNQYVATVLRKNPNFVYMTSISVSGNTDKGDDDDDDDNSNYAYEVDFDDQFSQFTTPRTITALSNWLNEFSYDELMTMMNTPVGSTNLLQEAMIAHCGETPFTLAVMQEILNQNPATATGSTTTLNEPAKYKFLHTAATRDELSERIGELTDAEKSEMLIYCVYDNEDNTQILDILVGQTEKLENNDMTTLMRLSSEHRLDKGNFDYMMSLSGKLPSMLSMINL